ncbi:MAG: hypothetical protein KJO35_00720, partial [Gammaproteobacteria bacterium]|nr:hypothetical protein [Gammaproteobacteria bacterium]
MSKKQVTVSLLKSLSPLDGLKAENLQALMKKTSVQEVSGGRYLFKEGDTTKRTIYVLTGAVELRTDSKVVRVIEGGSDEARHPLAPMLP